ncbi:interferon-induced GTP-binding protein Mx1 isoform X1 [Hylobates moloch]|uniref:interferon-induced GTP-binding protein Mx1 isoform X1 n=1 Tax=Hylobates moloch TaxID=81572 RepID=UPI0013626A5F|nr:interferon-induced GTP-binding protein Mx1 isoform X1 [Hylobates moloch]XP_032030150.1 interferon-induced GTP-binding protein Mx1 isoform X1 [Hylobates moloch]XP_032030151.1 interferon-induced GTP-binding protein Mx1 isoform X1 [Hylobates moloch]XP_058283519.1 interferon-induced GTP-binding protein Mx1 isoform X1 [Hylobates moloch]XP_058283520.1 interferon-induced GTP-binding protein Mx1 isoform X1 [Hylobates moloch]
MVLSEVDIAKADPAAASHPLLLNGDDNVAQKNPRLVAENNLCSQYEEKVRPCIDLIDSLRALGVEQDLALPAIAVIGDQSSGKSSVLEALSGVALPRGSGIVTRCPLVLKLKKLVNEDKWRGKVSYQDYEIEISDASEVEKEINKAQNTIAGEGMGISHELITLEISSQDVPDLTLIDLPGITRVAVGNQPADIGYKIKTLIKKYIQRQETISLVVVPSNVDIATTEALSMAQEVDPEGDRTIGILTKPDLVDKGTEDKIVDVVRNLVFHLKKGYMIVKCRGQQEIQDQLSLSEALQREKIFFEDHPYFRDLLEEGKATVPCLAEKLTSELIAHICKSLPLLESQIKESHQTITEELQKYGVDIPEDENEKMFFLIDKINAFNQDITALIQGEETVGEEDIRLFTRLRHEFHKWSTIIENNFQEGHKILSRKIQKFENQYRGRELPGFVNFRTFETIMKQQIKALEEPAVDMLHTVTDMVRLAFTDVSIKNFEEFFNLHRTAKFKIEDIRAEQEREGEKLIRLHFQMEQIVYCQDQVYRGALQKVREKEMEEEKKKKPWDLGVFQSSSTTDASMEELFQHLMAYHQEASKRISSHIPLIIQFFMLQTYGQQLQKAMLQLLQDKDTYSWLLKERSDTSDKRKFLKERLARLTQARRRLAQFPG